MAFGPRKIVHSAKAVHAPPSYFQSGYDGHVVDPGHKYPVAHAPASYFQPGYAGRRNELPGRKGTGSGHKKKAKHGIQRIHGSPMVAYRDPFGGRGMGKVRGR